MIILFNISQVLYYLFIFLSFYILLSVQLVFSLQLLVLFFSPISFSF